MAFDPIVKVHFVKSFNISGFFCFLVGLVSQLLYGREDGTQKWAKCPGKMQEFLLASNM